MAIEDIEIGQKITISRKLGDNEHFYSMVQNIEENVIYITPPYKGEAPLILTRNELIKVRYVSENAAYVFTSTFLGVHQETEVLRLFKISAPVKENIKRIQMRNFVRVPVVLDVEYLLPDTDKIYKGTAVDLSAGGIKLALHQKFRVNQVLELFFQVTKKKKPFNIALKAQVVRIESVDPQTNLYHAGLKFLNVKRSVEDTLVSFVFEKQMEQLRKR